MTVFSAMLVQAQAAAAAVGEETGTWGGPVWPAMLKMVAGLLVIIGALYVGSALLRRWQYGGSSPKRGAITIKESRPLGAKRMLCLVEVRGREVLLGVTPNRIEPLCHIDATEETSHSAFDVELKHRQPH